MYQTSTVSPPTPATPAWKHSLFAAYLGWTLDAFDFLIMIMVLRDVAAAFGAPMQDAATAITLTLGCRAIGAALFGRLGIGSAAARSSCSTSFAMRCWSCAPAWRRP